MFLLIATYGLRISEVVAITVDDIHWRQSRLRVRQSKTSSPLEPPLTNEVSAALVKHLKRTPPPPPYRRIFLRMRAPIGILKRTAVTKAFQAVVQKNGLSIPFHGPHCMRHSFANSSSKERDPSQNHRRHPWASFSGEHIHVSTTSDRRFTRSFSSGSGQRAPCKGGTAMTRATATFSSPLASVLKRYVDLKRSLGQRFDPQTLLLGRWTDFSRTLPSTPS